MGAQKGDGGSHHHNFNHNSTESRNETHLFALAVVRGMFFHADMETAPRREPIVITRVEQIRDSHWLIANCKMCHHSARLDCEALLDRFGPWLAIEDVRRRLRCASCGSRAVEMHTVSPGAGGIKNPAVATRG